MDVVAHTGAVGRGVVVAEDGQARAPADGHLGHVRHQVVGHAARILADASALVRAHRVEVAQDARLPAGLGRRHVAQDRLADQLGLAVRIRGARGRVLADRQHVGLAVDGGAGAEHDAVDFVGPHRGAESQQAADVVGVVAQGLLHRLAHGLERGEMDDGGDAMAREDGVHRVGVADAGALEDGRLAGQLLQAVEHLGRAVGEVVQADDVVARGQQFQPGVGGDVAGRASEQDRGHQVST